MVNENKDFIIFQPINAIFGDIKGVYYETCFFGAKTDKFLDVFNSYFPTTLQEYNEKFAYRFPNCLEHFFYESFVPYKEKTVLTEDYVKLYLKDSEINVSSYQNTKCVIISSELGNDYLYMANQNTSPYTFHVYIDDDFHSKFTMKNEFLRGDFSYFRLKEDCSIRIEIFNEKHHVKTETISYSINKKEEYKNNGIILFKNGEPSSNMFSTIIEHETNKINFIANKNIDSSTFVSIKDIDSKSCIFSFDIPETTVGICYWAIPIPINVLHFKNDINFGGVLIEYYQEGKLIESEEIRIKDVHVYKPKMDLTNTKSVYLKYNELFVHKIFDRIAIDDFNTIVDCNADIGMWTLYALSRNAKNIYCFEPDSSNIKDLIRNTKSYDNITVIQKKLGVSEDTNDGISLNEFLESNKLEKIDLLRIDIHNIHLIKSFEKSQFSLIDSFLIEYNDMDNSFREQINKRLLSYGYKIQEDVGDNFVFAYKQKKSYLIPQAIHQNYSQKNLSFSRINLYESSKNFNWSDFNSGKYYTFDQMYDELYREYSNGSNGCSYERYGCIIEQGDIVVDIGANIGMFTNVAFEKGASKIFAFEPTDVAYTCLLENKPRNCESFKMAISDKEGFAEIISPRISDPIGASIYGQKDENTVSNFTYITTIDSLFRNKLFDNIDFLKIDAEGSDLSILNGISNQNLSKIKKISMEFHFNSLGQDGSNKIWNRLSLAGFKGFDLSYGDGELHMYNFWRETI
jgi:FkbM family methyltransferase